MGLFPHVELFDDQKAFGKGGRHLFFFAHQDDECAAMGLLQRLAPGKVVWLTNGDGLARQNNQSLAAYAAARQEESLAAMALLGVPSKNCYFMGFSEEAIYQAFIAKDRAALLAAKDYFLAMYHQVYQYLVTVKPETIWTVAWQGGHTGHDLCHVMVALAARNLPTRPTIYELPQYELANLYVVRFSPWQAGKIYELSLTAAELRRKMQAAYSYESQTGLLEAMQQYLRFFDKLRRPGRWLKNDNPLGLEQFALVPWDRDYLKSPHRNPFLEYTGQRHDGVSFYNLFEAGHGERLTYHNTVGLVVRWIMEEEF